MFQQKLRVWTPEIQQAHNEQRMARGGNPKSKYPWQRDTTPKSGTQEMKQREINPIAGAVKRGADYASNLLDQGPSVRDVTSNLVGAIPFVGPDLRKAMEGSTTTVPIGLNMASNMPEEGFKYGEPAKYKKAGIETYKMPTTDLLDAMKVSDLVGTSGLSRAAESAGYGEAPDLMDVLDAAQVGGGLYGAAKLGAKGAKAAGKGALKVLEQAGTGPASGSMAAQRGIIKMPGGNWLGGEVEKQLKRLQMGDTIPKNQIDELKNSIDTAKRVTGGDATVDRAIRQMENELSDQLRNNALNAWMESNLTNYVKKQMGTADDPVRKLAEQDILHMEPFGNVDAGRLTMKKRAGLGYPYQGVGESDKAKFWERMSDASIDPYPAGSYKHGSLDESILANNPWLQNVPDETMIHSGKGLARELGFDHIMDVLRQDVREGRIRPEQLNKVSMEQAVRRTYEYDQEMAKKMRETQAKVTEGMPVHKEYPEGYKWIELKAPDYNSLPLEERKQMIARLTEEAKQKGLTPEDYIERYPESQLAEALKYEGDTMGHCVGGYCPDVLAGRSRIFSLRDAKGEPHVTVEVEPGHPLEGQKNLNSAEKQELHNQVVAQHYGGQEPDLTNVFSDLANYEKHPYFQKISEAYINKYGVPAPSIQQIKGKGNAAPKEEYLPFVQDFVKSGKWSEVRDLQNTGLKPYKGSGDLKYVTPEEYDIELKKELGLLPPEEGMKAGGEVRMSTAGWVNDAMKAAKTAKAVAEAKSALPAPAVIPNLLKKSTASEIGREERARRQAAGAAEEARVAAAKQMPMPIGYVTHTEKSPNPYVGYRYEADQPVGITPSPKIDVGALERSHKGASMLALPWDATNRNVRVSAVSGEDLAHPIWSHGGIPYSSDEQHLLENIGGASGRLIANRIVGREENARKENKLLGGTGEILHAVNTMGKGGENYALPSSEFAFDVINRRVNNGDLTLKEADDLSNEIRNYVDPDTKKQPFKNWAGFISRDGAMQMYTGEGLNGPAGDLRKVIADKIIYKKKKQELLNFNAEDFVNSITHDPLKGVGRGYIGSNLLSNVETSPMKLSKTADFPWLNPYDTNFSATHLGQLEDLVPIQAVMSRRINPIEQEFLAKQAAKVNGKPYTPESLQGSAISALEKRKDNVAQFMDDQFFQDLSDYMEALKKPLEKKKGGLAQAKKPKKVARHGNTVSN